MTPQDRSPSPRAVSLTCFLATGVTILLAVLGPHLDTAAAQAPGEHGIFVDTVDVSRINVEVVVTRDGEPVTDLVREDFKVLDDGEPVPITNFYRVDGGQRVELATDDDDATDEIPVAAGTPEPTTIVVLVDNSLIEPPHRKRIFNALRQKLDELFGAGARVMVVAKDRHVEMVQPATTDRAAIDAALDELERITGTATTYATFERRALRAVEQGAAPGTISSGVDIGEIEARSTYGEIRGYAQQELQNVRRTVRVLRRFLGSLAGLDGKKAVLYVADDLPVHPAELLFRVWFEKYGREYGFDNGLSSVEFALQDFDTTNDLRDLIADANASRVAFYPIGVKKSSAGQLISAEALALSTNPGFAAVSDSPGSPGLQFLARGTGGEASVQAIDPSWLVDRLRSDLGHYYSLGIPARHDGDGKAHRLKVVVDRPGVVVRHLESYRAKSIDQQMEDRTFAALLHDRLENPLGVRLAVGPEEKEKKGRFRVPVAVRIPLDRLVLLPGDGIRRGRVTLYFAVRDDKGRMSEPTRVEVPIRIGAEVSEGVDTESATYATRILVRRGAQTIAVGVRDQVGETTSTISRRILVEGAG